jgi:hypothetical protein
MVIEGGELSLQLLHHAHTLPCLRGILLAHGLLGAGDLLQHLAVGHSFGHVYFLLHMHNSDVAHGACQAHHEKMLKIKNRKTVTMLGGQGAPARTDCLLNPDGVRVLPLLHF